MKRSQVLRSASRLVLLSLILVLASCASGAAYRRAERNLERGDYTRAALEASASLSHDPKNEKALALLEKVFPLAIDYLRAESLDAQGALDSRRWERVVRAWESIHAINDTIQILPPLYRKGSKTPVGFDLVYDHELLARARAEAADARYLEASGKMAGGGQQAYRDAYESFLAAEGFIPSYRDALARAEEARSLGSDRIAVLPFGATPSSFEARACADALYSAFLSALVDASRGKTFLQVVDHDSIEALLTEREFTLSDMADPRLRADLQGFYGATVLAMGQVLTFEAQYPHIRTETQIHERLVEEPIPGAPPVDGIVPTRQVLKRATVTRFTKSASLSASVEYRAVNAATSIVVDADTVTERLGDSCAWAVFSGDRIALPSALDPLLSAREREIRGPSLLMADLAERLGRRLAQSLAERF